MDLPVEMQSWDLEAIGSLVRIDLSFLKLLESRTNLILNVIFFQLLFFCRLTTPMS
jgi:hypothetical protein